MANHRTGKIVPVYWLGFGPNNTKDTASPDGQHKQVADELEATKEMPEVVDVDASMMSVLYGQPFTIKETAIASPEGSISIRYSSFALMIANAGIDNRDMVWTFNALEYVYNINVCVLENALIAGDALSGTPKPGPNAIFDF
ncbi:MAG: hypothetical protein M1816_004699 [Peltula sp. TS41687]|nr:MAG: hypothetical protein M1816_004699 [Peltula sp. TS41687]